MPEHTNIILVEAAQSGDHQAFASLVEQYYGMVHGLAYSKVGDWAVAQDLTQDVFLTAWTNLSGLRHPEAFLVWLRRIARNSALNWLRTRQYQRRLAERNELERKSGQDTGEDPSGEAARKECLEHVGEALTTLTPKLREAMVLFYLEGHTAADSAVALGISVDTMKKRLRLGRRKLQKYYERRSVTSLDQLLPHRPKRQIQNIVAGLAIGPAMPELSASTAGSGASMWLQDLWHGASPKATFSSFAKATAGTVGTVKTGALASFIVVVGGAGAVSVLAPSGNDAERVPDSTVAVTVIGQDEERISRSSLTSDRMPSEAVDAIVVTREYAGATPNDVDLLVGDRIIRINGRPLSASGAMDPATFLGGLRGSTTSVTFIRPGAKGQLDHKITTDIIWPIQPTQARRPTDQP